MKKISFLVFAGLLFASLPAQAQDQSGSSAKHFALNPLESCKTALQIAAHRKNEPYDEKEAEKECLRKTQGIEPDNRQKLYTVCRKLDLYNEFLICMGDKTINLPAAPEEPAAAPAEPQPSHYKLLTPELKKTK